ncbi:MAG: histidine kinase [Paludibacter sp.]
MNKIEKYGGLYSKWYNLAFWIVGISLVIGVIFTLFMGKEFSLYNVLLPSLFNTVCLWLGSMSIVVFVWSRFPWESMPLKHLLVEIVLITIFLIVFILGVDMYLCYNQGTTMVEGIRLNLDSILFTVLITFLIVTIHEAIFFYRQWKLNFSKSVKLEKDNLEASYNTLKSQVNPHFLFNSLNSLMSLLDNNPTAEQYVQDLSDFLRYVLMSNDREVVSLDEELENIEKYIHLQKLRFQDNLQVEINIRTESLQCKIPPLTLQMLVENCIKHNTISVKNPLIIKISDNGKNISVVNNLQPKQVEESTGQGLKNIEGRYRFVAGEPIKIESDEKQFSVTLPLIIAP